MPLKDLYKTDPVANETGVWVAYPANSDGTIPRFRLARQNVAANKKYGRELDRATKPYRREIELDTLDEKVSDDVMLHVFCTTILLEWEYVQPDDDGKNRDFTEENAKALLGDPQWAELYEDLQSRAKRAALFRIAQQEKAGKN